MGWFEDALPAVVNPGGWATGQLFGSKAKSAVDKFNPGGFAEDAVTGSSNSIPGQLLFGNKTEDAGVGGGAIPDYTDQWTKLSQDLNGQKLQDANNNLQATAGGALANSTNNLAMKGGLSAGANERLAANNMNGFQDAYSNLATKFGLGSSEIAKQGLETKQDMALKLAESGDRVAAARAGAKGGGILGFLGL